MRGRQDESRLDTAVTQSVTHGAQTACASHSKFVSKTVMGRKAPQAVGRPPGMCAMRSTRSWLASRRTRRRRSRAERRRPARDRARPDQGPGSALWRGEPEVDRPVTAPRKLADPKPMRRFVEISQGCPSSGGGRRYRRPPHRFLPGAGRWDRTSALSHLRATMRRFGQSCIT